MARAVKSVHIIRNDGEGDGELALHFGEKPQPHVDLYVRPNPTGEGRQYIGGADFAMQDGRPTLIVSLVDYEESLVVDLRDGSVVQEASP